MKIRLFQIDAFADRVFTGNPAAVCPLDEWIEDAILQDIARENNLSETAFFVKEQNEFRLRWFTPETEVNLCGHATLAAAFVVFTELDPQRREVRFKTKSGSLTAILHEDAISMEFPLFEMTACSPTPFGLLEGLRCSPSELYCVEQDPNYFAILESEEAVRSVVPDLRQLEQLHPYGVVISAPGDKFDLFHATLRPVMVFRKIRSRDPFTARWPRFGVAASKNRS